jgi:hypothetical protein
VERIDQTCLLQFGNMRVTPTVMQHLNTDAPNGSFFTLLRCRLLCSFAAAAFYSNAQLSRNMLRYHFAY